MSGKSLVDLARDVLAQQGHPDAVLAVQGVEQHGDAVHVEVNARLTASPDEVKITIVKHPHQSEFTIRQEFT